MIMWYLIIVPSAIIGIIVGYFIKNKIGFILSGLLPFVIYFTLMQSEFFIFPGQEPYRFIWKLFGCTIAAIIGIISYLIRARFIFSKKIFN